MESSRRLPERSADQVKRVWDASRQGNFQQALKLLQQSPRLATKFYQNLLEGGNVRNRLLPFHMLLVFHAPLNILKETHKMNPQAVATQLDHFGFRRGLPLAYACSSLYRSQDGVTIQQVEELVEFLVEAYPKSLYEMNAGCFLPIHLVLRNKTHLQRHQWPSLKLVKLLLGEHLATSAAEDGAEDTIHALKTTGDLTIASESLPSAKKPKYSSLHSTRDNFDHPQECRLIPLEWAIRMEIEDEIIDYLINKFPSSMDQLKLDLSLGDDQAFTPLLVSKLIPIFGQVKSLRVICSKKLCIAGFLALLDYLSSSTSIIHLELLKLPNEYVLYVPMIWQAVTSCLAANTTLQNLTLQGRRHVHEEQEENFQTFLDAVIGGLRRNRVLRQLTMDEFDIPHARIVQDLLSDKTGALQELCLKGFRGNAISQKQNEWGHRSLAGEEWKPSQTLSKMTWGIPTAIHPCCLSGMLAKLGALPSLTKLSLNLVWDSRIAASRDLTHSLATILDHNRLVSLIVEISHCKEKRVGTRKDKNRSLNQNSDEKQEQGEETETKATFFDLVKLCKTALRTNTSLVYLQLCRRGAFNFDYTTEAATTLNTLEHHNATLENIHLIPKFPASQLKKLQYFCQLNQRGRVRARDPQTMKSQLVNLLIECQAEDEDQQPTQESHDAFPFLYGLLRELPSIWSS